MASSTLPPPSSTSGNGAARPSSPLRVPDLVQHFEGEAAKRGASTASPTSSPTSKRNVSLPNVELGGKKESSSSSSSSSSGPVTRAASSISRVDGPSTGSAALEDIQEGEKLQVEQGGKVMDDEQGDEQQSRTGGDVQKDDQNVVSTESKDDAAAVAGASASPKSKKEAVLNGLASTKEEEGETATKLPATGDSPLTKILERLDTLSPKEQDVIKANLERVGAYPRELPLSAAWTLHFSDTSGASKASHGTTADAYDDAVKAVFTSRTVFELCGTLKAYKRAIAAKVAASPNKRGAKPFGGAGDEGMGLTRPGQNLHFFRAGVSPTWEDPWNSKGGRLIIQPLPAMFEAVFERLVFLLAGSAVEVGATDLLVKSGKSSAKEGLIIGAVASRRARGDRIEVWLGGTEKLQPAPSDWIEAIKERLSEELELPEVKTGKYRTHFGK